MTIEIWQASIGRFRPRGEVLLEKKDLTVKFGELVGWTQ